MDACDRYLEKISAYIDEGIMDDKLKEHLETCLSCRNELDGIKNLVGQLNVLGEPPLPEGFHERAMAKLALRTRPQPFVGFSRYAGTAAAVVLCFILVGSFVAFINRGLSEGFFDRSPSALPATPMAAPAPAAAAPMAESAELRHDLSAAGLAASHIVLDSVPPEPALPPAAQAAAAPSAPALTSGNAWARGVTVEPPPVSAFGGMRTTGVHAGHDNLISRTTSISITVDDIDFAVTALRLAGYEIESSDISSLWGFGHLMLRIPAFWHGWAMQHISSLGEVTFEMEQASDLTHATNELAIRYLAARQESQRLSALITRAERAEDIILLQNRISRIERERARLRGAYNQNLGSVQNFSVNINLNAQTVTPVYLQRSFSERLGDGFTGSLNFTTMFFEGILVFFSYALVPLALVFALGGIGYVSVRKLLKRRGKH